jgi:hypothetical protein
MNFKTGLDWSSSRSFGINYQVLKMMNFICLRCIVAMSEIPTTQILMKSAVSGGSTARESSSNNAVSSAPILNAKQAAEISLFWQVHLRDKPVVQELIKECYQNALRELESTLQGLEDQVEKEGTLKAYQELKNDIEGLRFDNSKNPRQSSTRPNKVRKFEGISLRVLNHLKERYQTDIEEEGKSKHESRPRLRLFRKKSRPTQTERKLDLLDQLISSGKAKIRENVSRSKDTAKYRWMKSNPLESALRQRDNLNSVTRPSRQSQSRKESQIFEMIRFPGSFEFVDGETKYKTKFSGHPCEKFIEVSGSVFSKLPAELINFLYNEGFQLNLVNFMNNSDLDFEQARNNNDSDLQPGQYQESRATNQLTATCVGKNKVYIAEQYMSDEDFQITKRNNSVPESFFHELGHALQKNIIGNEYNETVWSQYIDDFAQLSPEKRESLSYYLRISGVNPTFSGHGEAFAQIFAEICLDRYKYPHSNFVSKDFPNMRKCVEQFYDKFLKSL